MPAEDVESNIGSNDAGASAGTLTSVPSACGTLTASPCPPSLPLLPQNPPLRQDVPEGAGHGYLLPDGPHPCTREELVEWVRAYPGTPGVWVGGGFCGHGMPFGPRVGQLLAEAAVTGETPEALAPLRIGRETLTQLVPAG